MFNSQGWMYTCTQRFTTKKRTIWEAWSGLLGIVMKSHKLSLYYYI